MPLRLLFILLFIAAGPLSAADDKEKAAPWWNPEWTIRKIFTVDLTDSGVPIADPVGTATVLVRLFDGNFQFTSAKEDGSDIRFIAADGKTQLSHHVEKYDGLLNEAFVWVKVPDLKPGAKTPFTLYYGNQGEKATRVDDVKGSFDPAAVLVYHFAERNAAPADSTANANNATTPGISSEGALIGPGLRLTGTAAVLVPAKPTLQWTEGGAMTWSGWVKPATLTPNAVVFSRREGTNAFIVGLDNGVPYVEVTGAGGTQRAAAAAPMAAGGWRNITVVAEGAKITLFSGGELAGTIGIPLPALNSQLAIGGDVEADATAPAVSAGFAGEFDEMQIYKAARSPGLIKLVAQGQGGETAAKMLSSGEDEMGGAGGGEDHAGHFATIIKNMTVDGWVVIILCGILLLVSWWVMITKAAYLNQLSAANDQFMKEWFHVSSDLTVLDNDDPESIKSLGGRVDNKMHRKIKNASVYRIYHIGVQEIRHRLLTNTARHGQRILSVNSIPAIRAALDTGLVRESQKLNSLMVFLTIAISGGPFLGLLGTVVGVMITFAAIAAAGDVNVNSIAPGIAAALLATVAGLAVAIPALFGYNYLLARVKNANADMTVFIDEFITKVAEFYCRDDASGVSTH